MIVEVLGIANDPAGRGMKILPPRRAAVAEPADFTNAQKKPSVD
jgi:hypothetical protein